MRYLLLLSVLLLSVGCREDRAVRVIRGARGVLVPAIDQAADLVNASDGCVVAARFTRDAYGVLISIQAARQTADGGERLRQVRDGVARLEQLLKRVENDDVHQAARYARRVAEVCAGLSDLSVTITLRDEWDYVALRDQRLADFCDK